MRTETKKILPQVESEKICISPDIDIEQPITEAAVSAKKASKMMS